MEVKKYHLIYLISSLYLFCSCSKSHEHIAVWDWHEYKIYDLAYNNTLYIGVCVGWDDKNNPQNIVYEVDAIKEYYETYGADTLLSEFIKSYDNTIEPIEWKLVLTHKTVPWDIITQKYIIYLALRNGYNVCIDDETGYLLYDK